MDRAKLIESLFAELAANKQAVEALEAEREAIIQGWQEVQNVATPLEWVTGLLETLRREQEQVDSELRHHLSGLLGDLKPASAASPSVIRADRLNSVCKRFIHLGARGIHVWKEEGAYLFLVKVAKRIHHKLARHLARRKPQPTSPSLTPHAHIFRTAAQGLEAEYAEWMRQNEPAAAELAQQRQTNFPHQPCISVVVSTSNTPVPHLLAMIESVRAQTYSHWELCIADGGSHNQCSKRMLDYYVRNDSRIKVAFLPKNQGIADNLNQAIALATGDYLTFLDAGDTLAPFALFEIVAAVNHYPDTDFLYGDEDKITEQGRHRFSPQFKPAWAPDTLRSFNYIAHPTVLARTLLDKIGGFRSDFDGAHDYDLILRATEQAQQIVHVPKVLYHGRNDAPANAGGIAAAEKALREDPDPIYRAGLRNIEAAEKALHEHLARCLLDARVQRVSPINAYRVRYHLPNHPLVSLIIPNKDHVETLRRCLNSIADSTYKNYEIIIVENNSCQSETFAYYAELEKRPEVRVVSWNHPFNYAAATNFGVRQSRGEVLLLLNNDVEVINRDWLESLLEHALRAEVGAVGAKLYYPNGLIQHGGVTMGLTGIAGHCGQFSEGRSLGYLGLLQKVQNVSAVTGACLMVRRNVYEEVGGLDERFVLAFNDVDFCVKIRQGDYLIIWTPYAELYHFESLTRGYEDTPEKRARLLAEARLFDQKWGEVLEEVDPYYSPNLTLTGSNWAIRTDGVGPAQPRVVASRVVRSLAA